MGKPTLTLFRLNCETVSYRLTLFKQFMKALKWFAHRFNALAKTFKRFALSV